MIFTFYSYKGGVGRTMALANIAELLYAKGCTVLMIDWDLESPGLETYFPSVRETAQERRGLLNMLLSYKNLISKTPPPSGGEGMPFDDIKDYVIEVHSSDSKQPNTGTLYLLSAGKRDNSYFAEYAEEVKNFDWADFYENLLGEQFFEWFRRGAENLAPIILIDSRSGVSEVNGICTYQLADVVIAFTSSNQQSIDGTVNLVKRLNSSQLADLRSNRSRLGTIVVPSRVEQTELIQRNKFEKRFRDEFDALVPKTWHDEERSFWRLCVPYTPLYAFEELVAFRERGGERSAAELVRSYERLWAAMVDVASPPGKEPWRWRQLQSDVLIVEDTPAWQELLQGIIVKRTGGLCDIAATREMALNLLEKREYRLIILNLNLPQADSEDQLGYEGIDILDFIKATGRKIPVMIVTGATDLIITTGEIFRRYSDVKDIFFKGTRESIRNLDKVISDYLLRQIPV